MVWREDDLRREGMAGLDTAGTTRLPSGAELELLQTIDPKSLRDKEVKL